MLKMEKEETSRQLNKNYIKQEEINQRLKKISTRLRSVPNIGNDYMEYISALIYVMYELRENLQYIIENSLKNIHYLIDTIEYELRNIRKKEASVKLFSNIKFYEIFHTENQETLRLVIFELGKLILQLEDSDENIKSKLAIAFEYLIMKAAQDNVISFRNSEFYTPKGLVKTMIKLLDVQPNMAIYNPSCGTGNFITEAAKLTNIYAFGEENNINSYNICITNLWIHDVYNKRIKENNYEEFQLVDLAIANPPFSSEIKEDIQMNRKIQDIYYRYDINQSTSTYVKYLVKMIESVHERGKVAIVVPHGFLFKKNDYRIRSDLIYKNYIDAIIALPEKLFYNTKISVVILIIDKAKKRKGVLFIDASKEYTIKRKTNILAVENQEKIVETYKNYKEIENYSYIANYKEIKNNDYDLNISKYIQNKYEIEKINQDDTQKSIYNLEQERKEIQKQIEKLIQQIK